jgi:hypothetical protein
MYSLSCDACDLPLDGFYKDDYLAHEAAVDHRDEKHPAPQDCKSEEDWEEKYTPRVVEEPDWVECPYCMSPTEINNSHCDMCEHYIAWN